MKLESEELKVSLVDNSRGWARLSWVRGLVWGPGERLVHCAASAMGSGLSLPLPGSISVNHPRQRTTKKKDETRSRVGLDLLDFPAPLSSSV